MPVDPNVRHVAGDTYYVRSTHGPHTYLVVGDACECLGYQHRRTCAHVELIERTKGTTLNNQAVTVYDHETQTKSQALTAAQVVGVTPWDDEKRALIKRTLFKDATNDELALFAMQCQRMGLDPFSKQIYAWKDTKQGKVVFMTSIDGLRTIAQRTGRYVGQVGPEVCGLDGVWVDLGMWPEGEGNKFVRPVAARVGVRTSLAPDYPTYGYARWDEFNRPNLDTWKYKGLHMLCIVAERQALRKTFPNDLQGIELDVAAGVSINVTNPDTNQPENEFPIRETPKQVEPPRRGRKVTRPEAAVDTPPAPAPTPAPPPPLPPKPPAPPDAKIDPMTWDFYQYLAKTVADNEVKAAIWFTQDEIDGDLEKGVGYLARVLTENNVDFDDRGRWEAKRP